MTTLLEAMRQLRDAGVLSTSGTADPAWTAKETARQALAYAELTDSISKTHHCRVCGDECPSGGDCCFDEFPEPGDIRETGR
jgi:Fe-S oxidoreductase